MPREMAEADDPYSVLGVPRGAEPEEVRRAYRGLALRLHPDKNPGSPSAAEEFARVSRAFAVLSDPVRRSLYDRAGVLDDVSAVHDADAAGRAFFDFLAASVGRPGGDEVPAVDIEIGLSLDELCRGCVKRVEFERLALCRHCDSSSVCQACGGTGRCSVVSPPGMAETFVHLLRPVPCAACRGARTAPKVPLCGQCRGKRMAFAKESFEVRVPPRTADGHVVILPGRGAYDASAGGYRDARLRFGHVLPAGARVDPATFDLHVEAAVSLREVLCGFERAIRLGSAEFTIKVDAYRDPSCPLVVPGRGAGGEGTSLVVRFAVAFPPEASAEAAGLRRRRAVFGRIFSHDESSAAESPSPETCRR